MPLIETGPEAPGRHKQNSNGAVQALIMILAWVGGAGAAIVAAYWILQYVNPSSDTGQGDVNPTVVESVNEENTVDRKLRRKVARRAPDRKSTSTNSKDKNLARVDRQNFQRPAMPGFMFRFYVKKPFRMKDFGKTAVHRSGVLFDRHDMIQISKLTGLQLEGFWDTKTEQACEFTLDSTNSGRLWIDGQLVLDNTTLFQPGPVKATRTIQPGVHNVRVESMAGTESQSVPLSSFQLKVAGVGSSNRKDLDQLLRPFESPGLSVQERLQYELAKYPQKKMVQVTLPGGRVLAGLAISAQLDGRIAGVKPIYLNKEGLFAGKTLGRELGQWATVVAKPGYAVSDVQFEGVDLAVDVQTEFMRIGKQLLTQAGAYTQTVTGDSRSVKINASKPPVIDLDGSVSKDLKLLAVESVRAKLPTTGLSSSKAPKLSIRSRQLVSYLADGFPASKGRKMTPRPSIVTKGLKKRSRESNERLSGKKGDDLDRELKSLANSIEAEARNSTDSDAQFVALLEARRLYIVAGDFGSAFAIGNVLLDEFEYDHWKDLLLLFEDMTKRAGKDSWLQQKVCDQLAPAIFEAQEKFEFEVAGKLATGGKVLATRLNIEEQSKKYQQQVEEFKQLAQITKQARAAAKMLVDKSDDKKANRSMAVFFLRVSEDWDAAMYYFARSGNKDCEFIAEHDRNSKGADAAVTAELADCWKRVAKKNRTLEDVAYERARKILEGAR